MRIFLSLVLAAGAVFGIGGGIARLHHGGRHHREHMMDRVAETCVRAARTVDQEGPDGRPGPGGPGGPDGHHGRGPHGPRGDHFGGPMHGPQPAPQTVFVPYPVAMPMMPAPAMPMPPAAGQVPLAAQTAPAPGR